MPSSIDILTRVLQLIQQLDPTVQCNETELQAVMSTLKQVELGIQSVQQKFEARSADQLQHEIDRFKTNRSVSSHDADSSNS